MFTKELNFFIKNQNELVRLHGGKVLAIKGTRVIGVYESELQAYIECQESHTLGTFMIQVCEPGPEAYSFALF